MRYAPIAVGVGMCMLLGSGLLGCGRTGFQYISVLPPGDADGDVSDDVTGDAGGDVDSHWCGGLDEDDDGVCDAEDVCPGYPDNVDTDGDGIPDGCDSCIGDNNRDLQGNDGPCGPELIDATFLAYNELELLFDRDLDAAAAIVTSRYALAPTRPTVMAIESVEPGSTADAVVLHLTANHLPLTYTVTADATDAHAQSWLGQSREVQGTQSRLVFISSASGTGNLGSWTDAGGQTGIAAADAVCQLLATSQGFLGNFAAPISDGSVDATCHLEGFAAKLPDCGQSGFAPTLGPWVNSQGELLTVSYADGLAGHIRHSLRYTEAGARTAIANAWSGTSTSGAASFGNTCLDWTSNNSADGGIIGYVDSNVMNFASHTYSSCNSARPLICVQTDAGGFTEVPVSAQTGRVAFVTSTTGPGDLSQWQETDATGVVGGDEICAVRAAAGGLAGAYRAWLSDGTDDAYCRVLGLSGKALTCGTGGGPWVTPTGVLIANDVADLISTPFNYPIHVDENGDYAPLGEAWTGTDEDGSATLIDCNAWSDTAVNGTEGRHGFASSRSWTTYGVSGTTCTWSNRLYCLQTED